MSLPQNRNVAFLQFWSWSQILVARHGQQSPIFSCWMVLHVKYNLTRCTDKIIVRVFTGQISKKYKLNQLFLPKFSAFSFLPISSPFLTCAAAYATTWASGFVAAPFMYLKQNRVKYSGQASPWWQLTNKTWPNKIYYDLTFYFMSYCHHNLIGNFLSRRPILLSL